MVKLKDGFTGERALVLPRIIVDKMEEDPLTSMLHITDIGYYPKAKHHFRERKEPINQYVFIYCIDGAGSYRIGDQEYTVSANQYFILPAGVPHSYASNKSTPWTIYCIHFKGILAPFYAKDAYRPLDIQPEQHSRISTRINLFEEIFNTLKNGYSNENLRYAFSMFHFYLGTLRYVQQYRNAGTNEAEDEGIVNVAIHYMKENMEKHLSLEEISTQIGYSPSHFSMLFKKQTGHSPLTYFNLLKMQQACLLLDTTDMKINQICYKIGIEDTYKKYLGDKIIIGKNCEYVFHYLNAHDEDQMDPDRDFVYDVEASKLTFGGQVSYWLDKIMGYHVKAREIEQTEFIQVLYSNDKVPFEMRPKNVGTGVTYITELIIAALACKANDLLVIENPEIHLHPSGQSELVEFLAFLAQCGVQIIVETHSDHIYNGIRKSIRLDQIDDDKVSIYSFEQDERGCSIPISIPINANGKALKNAEGFFDQINKDLDVILGW